MCGVWRIRCMTEIAIEKKFRGIFVNFRETFENSRETFVKFH